MDWLKSWLKGAGVKVVATIAVIATLAIIAIIAFAVIKYFMMAADMRDLKHQLNNLTVEVTRYSPTMIGQNHAMLIKLNNTDVTIKELRDHINSNKYKLAALTSITLEVQKLQTEGLAKPDVEIPEGTHQPDVKYTWQDEYADGWLICPTGVYGISYHLPPLNLEIGEMESGEMVVVSDNPFYQVRNVRWQRRPEDVGFWSHISVSAALGAGFPLTGGGKVGGSWDWFEVEVSADTHDTMLWIGARKDF